MTVIHIQNHPTHTMFTRELENAGQMFVTPFAETPNSRRRRLWGPSHRGEGASPEGPGTDFI